MKREKQKKEGGGKGEGVLDLASLHERLNIHTPPHVFVNGFWFCYNRCACATAGCMGVARPAAASSVAEGCLGLCDAGHRVL